MPPTFKQGNMWNQQHHLFLVTTNNVITRSGLVMGAGVAKSAVDKYGPRIKKLAATAIEATGDSREYGFVTLAPSIPELGLFQTKRHYRQPSDLALIEFSVRKLLEYALRTPNLSIALPMPGIGLGGLKPDDVIPILKDLPENVTVYRL